MKSIQLPKMKKILSSFLFPFFLLFPSVVPADWPTDLRLALTNFTNISSLALGIAASGAPKITTGGEQPGNPDDWILTFNDEFNGTSLDRTKWITKYPFKNHQDDGTDDGDRSNNQESEWYVDNAFSFNNGVMSINAKYECLAAGRPERYAPYSCTRFPYTSGLIASAQSFSQKYGYFETRMKIPSGDGFWPTFWLLPKNSPQPATTPWSVSLWPPEIDIMENFSYDLTAIRLSNIYSNIYPNPGTTGDYRSLGGFDYDTHYGPDYSQALHTYGVDWEPDFVAWYIDGVEVRRVTTHIPPGTPPNGSYDGMFILVNLAVSTGNGNISLPSPSSLPKTLDVDYVRVYQKKSSFPVNIFLPFITSVKS